MFSETCIENGCEVLGTDGIQTADLEDQSVLV